MLPPALAGDRVCPHTWEASVDQDPGTDTLCYKAWGHILTQELLLAALDLLLNILQQHVNRAADRVPILALKRGVTEDEHSAALKLLEVKFCSCICLKSATLTMAEHILSRHHYYMEAYSLTPH